MAKTPKSANQDQTELGTKKSIIEYRTSKDNSTLFGVLSEIERSIADMTRIFAELPSSGRLDVGGKEKLTTRQTEVLGIIAQSQRRADEIVRLIKQGGKSS